MTGAETLPIIGTSLAEWLSVYGYWVMFPLMVIEGPVVGFTAGILISYGVFNPVIVFLVFVAATTVTDTIIYMLARYSEPFLLRFSYSRRVVRAVREDQKTDEGWTETLDKHFTRFFILTKVTPVVAIGEVLLIAAGVLRISAKKVYLGTAIGQPIWSAAILSLGFYFGNTIQDFSYLMNVTGIIMTVLVAAVIAYFLFYEYLIAGTAFGKMIESIKRYDYKKHMPDQASGAE